MGKAITNERALKLFGVYLTNVDLTGVDDSFVEWTIQNPREAGEQMRSFLRNRGKVVIREFKNIPIDRSQLFDPVAVRGLGWGWTIWKGPIDGDGLSGEEEHDHRALAITELDLSKVSLETGIGGGEMFIKGETQLARLKKAGRILLDVTIFQTLWKNQILIPLHWKDQTNGNTTYISFGGTVLRHPDGSRHVLSLYWTGGSWSWSSYWLGLDSDVSHSMAVLANVLAK